GYGAGAASALLLVRGASGWGVLAAVFALSGLSAAAQEVLEDTVAAGLLSRETRGTGFGVLAAVNGLGDLVSSIGVGALWAALGPAAAFGAAALLMALGALTIGRAPASS